MQAWLASPYRAVGIYVGGVNRGCANGGLTGAWVGAVQALGWSLLPLFFGRQAPCVGGTRLAKIDAAAAASEGVQDADDAAARAAAVGIGPGNPI